MAEIFIKDNESIDEALRRFKKECERAGIMQEIKKREFYESPSMKKKRKNQEFKNKLKNDKRKRDKSY